MSSLPMITPNGGWVNGSHSDAHVCSWSNGDVCRKVKGEYHLRQI